MKGCAERVEFSSLDIVRKERMRKERSKTKTKKVNPQITTFNFPTIEKLT